MENNEKDILDTDEGVVGEKKEDGNKVAKAFDQNLDKIEAILGEKPSKGRRKLKGDKLTSVVETLYKEDDERLEKEFKEELKGLLDNFILFNEETRKKEEELKNLRTQKMKEFNDKSRKVWAKIEGGDGTINKRVAALRASTSAVSTTSPETKPE